MIKKAHILKLVDLNPICQGKYNIVLAHAGLQILYKSNANLVLYRLVNAYNIHNTKAM